MRLLRLLWITGNFPTPDQPARGVFNLSMAKALAVGQEVDVVAPVPWPSALRRVTASPRSAGLRVHYPRFWYLPKMLQRYHGTFLWWSIRRTVERIVADSRPDAVLGYWAHPDGEAAVRAARQAGVPAVVMVGGSDVLLLTKQPARRRCIERVLRSADAVVAVSEDLREKTIALGVDPAAVHVVPRGIDHDRFFPGDRHEARRRLGIEAACPILLWVGRMVPVKGLDVLLEACSRLAARGARFHTHLVGDGPLRSALAAECRARRLADVISFAGPVSHEQLPDWYRAADLTVLPSRSEGIPNVLRESLACGTPFVASRVGGIPEIADAETCRLVSPDNAQLLADAILEMLTRSAPEEMGVCALPSWPDAAGELMKVVRTLIARRGRHAPGTVAPGELAVAGKEAT